MTDEDLWTAFRTCVLPDGEWRHRTHIRVAWMHLSRWPLDEAHVRMRVGIVRLNASHGLEETPERGYHETLTYMWFRAIAAARARDADSGRASADSDAFCKWHPELLDKLFPLRFYSRDLLFSLRARAVFVEPDLGPVA